MFHMLLWIHLVTCFFFPILQFFYHLNFFQFNPPILCSFIEFHIFYLFHL